MELFLLILLFVGLLILLCMGYPIGFAMGTVVVVGIICLFDTAALFQIVQIAAGMGTNFMLLVLPLFILMSELILVSGMADDAFNAGKKWLNWLPGSLAISSIFACAAFAAVCGSSVLTAATIGNVAIPGMRERGYHNRLAAGIVATSGTIGIMIPPSICLIIYGVMTGVSIGQLFIAALIPGIIMTVALAVTVIILVKLNPSLAPPITEKFSWKDRFSALIKVGPVIALCVFIIMSIYTGLATPTEAGAVGATAAFFLLLIKSKFKPAGLRDALERTARLTNVGIILMIGGSAMAFLVSYTGLTQELIEYILGQGFSRWWVMIFINLLMIFLGCLLDPMGILVLSIPIVYPIVDALGFDPVWFGIVLTINVEIGMITPPVGLNLYVINMVDDSISIGEIIFGALPFLLALFFILGLILLFPDISLWLPSLM